ncbi:MAG: prepilin peptidase [Bacilli bacterium]|nr:prepilin peptidase [Bacilli bacterium]
MIYLVSVFIFILGTVLASFIGVIIYRVPNKMSIVKPDSFCPHCKQKIKWYDNIPILSFIILKGKCRYCHSPIGYFSFILEILGGVSFLLAFLQFRLSYDLIFVLLLVCLFLVIGGIDYQTHYIYDLTQVIYFILTLGYVSYLVFYLKMDYMPYLIGALVGFLFFFLIKVIGKLVMKQECLGMGDVILMTISGLLLGYQCLIIAILVGSLLGSIIEVTLISLKKKSRDSEIAFGPYLLIGTYFALLYGNLLIDFYIRLVI